MTDKNKTPPASGRTRNNKQQPGAGAAPPQEQQQIMAFIVPSDVFTQMVAGLDKLPRADTALLYKHLETMRPQMVPVSAAGGGQG